MSEDHGAARVIPLYTASRQPEAPPAHSLEGRIIPFSSGKTKDIGEGMHHYFFMLQRGIQEVYGRLFSRWNAITTFPAHAGALLDKDFRQRPLSPFYAAARRFDTLVRRACTNDLTVMNRESIAESVSHIPALEIHHQGQSLRAFREGFERVRNQLVPYPEVLHYFNPELRAFGEAVYEWSWYFRKAGLITKQLAELMLHPGTVLENMLPLEYLLAPYATNRQLLSESIRTQCTDKKHTFYFLTDWYHHVEEQREGFLSVWIKDQWGRPSEGTTPGNGFFGVFPSDFPECTYHVHMPVHTACEEANRLWLATEFYELILSMLEPLEPPLMTLTRA